MAMALFAVVDGLVIIGIHSWSINEYQVLISNCEFFTISGHPLCKLIALKYRLKYNQNMNLNDMFRRLYGCGRIADHFRHFNRLAQRFNRGQSQILRRLK